MHDPNASKETGRLYDVKTHLRVRRNRMATLLGVTMEVVVTATVLALLTLTFCLLTGCSGKSKYMYVEAETFTGTLNGGPFSGQVTAKNLRIHAAPGNIVAASEDIIAAPDGFFPLEKEK